MISMKTLKGVGIGDLVAFRFFNKTKATQYNPTPQKDIDIWICIAKVTNKFEEQSYTARRSMSGEVYRIIKKVQFQIDVSNPSTQIDTYLGVRNDRSKRFECAVDYNTKSWEICKIENEKDKIEIIKNIMADVLENGTINDNKDLYYLAALPSFQSAPWLDYGGRR
jgi:hypothetical protein